MKHRFGVCRHVIHNQAINSLHSLKNLESQMTERSLLLVQLSPDRRPVPVFGSLGTGPQTEKK